MAIYYVNPSAADDLGLGTTVGDPWQTLGAHIATVAASDDVYFLAGETITENAVTWADDGTAGNRCTIGRYDSVGIGINTADVNPIWDLPAGQTQALSLVSRSYITVENLQFTGGEDNAANRYFLNLDRANNVKITGCNFFNTPQSNCIWISSLAAVSSFNIDIENCTFSDLTTTQTNRGNAIYLEGNSTTNGSYNISITKCAFTNMNRAVYIFVYVSGTMTIAPYGFTFSDNVVTGCVKPSVDIHGLATNASCWNYIQRNQFLNGGGAAETSINMVQLSYCQKLIVEDNLLDGFTVTGAGDGNGIELDLKTNATYYSDNVIVRNNEVKNMEHGGIKFYCCSNSSVYNNYIHDNGTFGIAQSNAECTGNTVYNNTVVSNGTYGFWSDAGSPAITLTNNIFALNGVYGLYNLNPTSVVPTSAYNCFYGNVTANTWNFETTAAIAIGVGSILDNPLLASGVCLDPCSPCIRAGLTIDTVTHDIDGYKRPGRPGNNYSIGCCEYLGTNDPDHDENCRLPYR